MSGFRLGSSLAARRARPGCVWTLAQVGDVGAAMAMEVVAMADLLAVGLIVGLTLLLAALVRGLERVL